MRSLLHVLKWLLGSAAALLALAVLAVLILRALPPDPAQVALLERLSTEPPEPEGRNAFAALWLLPYEVSAGQAETLVAEDLARAQALPVVPPEVAEGKDPATVTAASSFRSVAADRFTGIPNEDIRALCQTRSDCLAQVRDDPERHRAIFARHAGLAERTLAIADHDYLRDRFPRLMEGPTVSFSLIFRTLPTTLALMSVDQGVEAALTESCRQLGAWRRFARDPSGLLQRLLSISMVRELTFLSARLMAQLPSDRVAPRGCEAALAAIEPADWDMCPAMAEEYRLNLKMTEVLYYRTVARMNWLRRLLLKPLFDQDHGERFLARTFGVACGAPLQAHMARDLPVSAAAADPGIPVLECAAAAVSCSLAQIAAPAYYDYFNRSLDHAARLRLLAAAAWLRARTDAAAPLAQRLAALPDALRGPPERKLEAGEDGRSLRIALYANGPDRTWSIPLAGTGAP